MGKESKVKQSKATKTYDTLVERYGVLLDYKQLAEIFQRSPDGLRISLSSPRDDFTRRLNEAKVQYGRRVLFRTLDVSELITPSTADLSVQR
jgi:hypothetical protein